MTDESKPEKLQLVDIPHPVVPRSSVRVFRDAESACRHLRDHLLTAPECDAWAIICPEYADLIDLNHPNSRFRFWQEVQRTEGLSAKALYDIYCRAIRANAEDAKTLGWLVGNKHTIIALGTDGLVIIFHHDTVTTAFLPGKGTPEAVRDQRHANPRGLPRESGMRSGRPNRWTEEAAHRDRLIRQRREASWTRDQRIYYCVFRPSLQFLRRVQRVLPKTNGNKTVLGYEALKQVIPPLSLLKWPIWQHLRRRCGREDHHG